MSNQEDQNQERVHIEIGGVSRSEEADPSEYLDIIERAQDRVVFDWGGGSRSLGLYASSMTVPRNPLEVSNFAVDTAFLPQSSYGIRGGASVALSAALNRVLDSVASSVASSIASSAARNRVLPDYVGSTFVRSDPSFVMGGSYNNSSLQHSTPSTSLRPLLLSGVSSQATRTTSIEQGLGILSKPEVFSQLPSIVQSQASGDDDQNKTRADVETLMLKGAALKAIGESARQFLCGDLKLRMHDLYKLKIDTIKMLGEMAGDVSHKYILQRLLVVRKILSVKDLDNFDFAHLEAIDAMSDATLTFLRDKCALSELAKLKISIIQMFDEIISYSKSQFFYNADDLTVEFFESISWILDIHPTIKDTVKIIVDNMTISEILAIQNHILNPVINDMILIQMFDIDENADLENMPLYMAAMKKLFIENTMSLSDMMNFSEESVVPDYVMPMPRDPVAMPHNVEDFIA